jgi:hypothetical protein
MLTLLRVRRAARLRRRPEPDGASRPLRGAGSWQPSFCECKAGTLPFFCGHPAVPAKAAPCGVGIASGGSTNPPMHRIWGVRGSNVFGRGNGISYSPVRSDGPPGVGAGLAGLFGAVHRRHQLFTGDDGNMK